MSKIPCCKDNSTVCILSAVVIYLSCSFHSQTVMASVDVHRDELACGGPARILTLQRVSYSVFTLEEPHVFISPDWEDKKKKQKKETNLSANTLLRFFESAESSSRGMYITAYVSI